MKSMHYLPLNAFFLYQGELWVKTGEGDSGVIIAVRLGTPDVNDSGHLVFKPHEPGRFESFNAYNEWRTQELVPGFSVAVVG